MENEDKALTASLEAADKVLEAADELPKEHVKQEGEVRTYATDIGEMMKREKGSVIKIALAEQKRRDEFKKKMDPTATKNIVVMLAGIALIVGGIMVFVYSIMNRSKPVPVTNYASSLPSFFFTENQIQIDMTELNRTELVDTIHAQMSNTTLVPETFNNLFVSYKTVAGQAPVPSNVFFQKLGIVIPDGLFQNLYPSFMLGIYNETTGNDLFMVFKVKEFNETFLAMREWEPRMLTELVRLYDIDTSGYGKAIFNKEFTTVTMFNKEARVLKDDSGKVVLSYIFLDPKTVMITTETPGLEEVIKRMNLQTIR